MRKTREILRQKWVLGRTHREVAAAVGVSAGAVGATLTRAAEAGLDQRAIDGEVLAAHEALSPGALDDRAEEVRRDLVLEQALAVEREDRPVEDLLGHVHVEKPAVEQVVAELLAEHPLAPDTVERHQHARLQEPLGRDRGPSGRAEHAVERNSVFAPTERRERSERRENAISLGGEWRDAKREPPPQR